MTDLDVFPRPHYDEDADEDSPVEVRALKHAFFNILMFPPESQYWQGLLACEVNDIDDLMMLDPLNDLKGIKCDYDEDGSNDVKTGVFTPMVLRKLKQLQEFFVAKDIEPISEWFTYSHNDLRNGVRVH